MKRQLLPLIGLLTSVMLVPLPGEALAAANAKQAHHAKKSDLSARHQKSAHKGGKHSRVASRHKSAPSTKDTSRAPTAPPLAGDFALVRDAIDQVRKAKTADATAIEAKIADPAAQKLVE